MAKKGMIIKSAVAAAVTLACSQAFAQSNTIVSPVTAVKYAKQIFPTNGPGVTLPPLTYATASVSGGIPVNNNACVDFYLTLTNGTFGTAATPVVPAVSAAAFSGLAAVGAPQVSTNATTVIQRYVNSSGATIFLGVGSQTTVTTTAGGVSGTAALASGGTISASGGLNSPGLVNVPTACPAATVADADATARNLEANSAPKVVAESADGVTVTVLQSGAFPNASFAAPAPAAVKEEKVIEVTLSTPAPGVTMTGTSNTGTATLINLGGIRVVGVTGVKQRNGVTDYDTSAAAAPAPLDGSGNVSVAIGATSGAFLTLAANNLLSVRTGGADCLGATVGTIPATNTASGTTITAIPRTAYGAGQPLYVCYDTTAIAAASRNIVPVLANATVTVGTAVTAPATTGGTSFVGTTTNLYDLKQNGKVINVTSYLPAALASFGFPSYIRVVNAGGNPSPLLVQMINADGTLNGTPVTFTGTVEAGPGGPMSNFTGNLAVGASVTITSRQLETALATGAGFSAPTTGMRPRIRISGAFGRLQVQSYIGTPDGGLVSLSQDYDSSSTQPN
jgi:hypothetical protein